MDANDVKKKFFDVTPPAAPAAKVTPKKRQLIVVEEPKESPTEPPSEFSETDGTSDSKVEVKHEKIVQPPAEADEVVPEQPKEPKQESVDTASAEVTVSESSSEPEEPKEPIEKTDPGVNPLPVEAPEKVNVAPAPEPEDVDTPIAASYSAVDSLPDDNQKTAEGIKLDSQEPKIYDTKAYHIPIKETTHGHGTKSAFVFGTVFALVFVGGLVYVLAVIAK